ncbi:hypothetical protein [Shewanella algidipiscicola]|uniref:hypothetical protein n=1 Tax=Shewanella algidipiscicola TaxID=614070 RepID=UPI000E70C9BF|nr:hypothetical protein [Shewanella algidipiscicola]
MERVFEGEPSWQSITCGELMCKRSFGSPQARPCGLCEIIHDFEGQNRAYTYIYRLFDLAVFGVNSELKANVLLPPNELTSCRWFSNEQTFWPRNFYRYTRMM